MTPSNHTFAGLDPSFADEPHQVSFFLFPRKAGAHPSPIRLGTGSYADVYHAEEVVVLASNAREIAEKIHRGKFSTADNHVLLRRPCAAKVLNRERALDDGGCTATDEAGYLRDLVGQPHVVQLLGATDGLPPVYICGNPDCNAEYAFHRKDLPDGILPCGCKSEFLITVISDSSSCIFLERLDITLRDYIQRTRSTDGDIARCVTVFECLAQAALGLYELHAQGKCHLDIATRNLMIRWQSRSQTSDDHSHRPSTAHDFGPAIPDHPSAIEAKIIDLGKTLPLTEGEYTMDHDRAPPMYHPEERRLRVDFPVRWSREAGSGRSVGNHYDISRHVIRCDIPPVKPEAGDSIKDSQEARYLIKDVSSLEDGHFDLQLELLEPPSVAGRMQLPDENITYIYKRGIATDVSLFGNTIAEALFDGHVQRTENFYAILLTAKTALQEALSKDEFSFSDIVSEDRASSILSTVILPPPAVFQSEERHYTQELYRDICNAIFRVITRCYLRTEGAYCAKRNGVPSDVCDSLFADIQLIQKKLALYEIMSHGDAKLLHLIGQQDTGDLQQRLEASHREVERLKPFEVQATRPQDATSFILADHGAPRENERARSTPAAAWLAFALMLLLSLSGLGWYATRDKDPDEPPGVGASAPVPPDDAEDSPADASGTSTIMIDGGEYDIPSVPARRDIGGSSVSEGQEPVAGVDGTHADPLPSPKLVRPPDIPRHKLTTKQKSDFMQTVEDEVTGSDGTLKINRMKFTTCIESAKYADGMMKCKKLHVRR